VVRTGRLPETPAAAVERLGGARRCRRPTLLALAAVLALAVRAVPTAATPPIGDGAVSASLVCGGCHRDIYRMWRASAHAEAMDNLVFMDAYREAEARDPDSVRLCLGCHAPLVVHTGDRELTARVTWEGVSCDTCHSLVAVELAPGGARQTFAPGRTKRGPIPDAASGAHDVSFSPLHTTALVCAGCHEFTSADGTPIITTYTEWQASAAARAGTSCQSCHMGLTRADVVDPKVKRVAMTEVNLHEMPGGHSAAQLNKALLVQQDATRRGDDLEVVVRLRNRGAGHAVPTGMPGRRVILAVAVGTSDGRAFDERRVYTKTFRDAAGELIERDGGVFAAGVRLASDSRLAAGEQRTEVFHFPVAATASANVAVSLHYEHAPGTDPQNRTWLTFFSQSRLYKPEAP
jgi:hypothetical protein